MRRRSLLALASVVMVMSTACATSKPIELVPGAKDVKIYSSDPPENLKVIDEVIVSDGNGCGAYGTRGTFDNARLKLRNRVVKIGGTAARIDVVTQPYNDGSCLHNEYTLRATVYGDGRDLAEASKWPESGPNGEVVCDGNKSSDRIEWSTPKTCSSYVELLVSSPDIAKPMAERQREKMKAK